MTSPQPPRAVGRHRARLDTPVALALALLLVLATALPAAARGRPGHTTCDGMRGRTTLTLDAVRTAIGADVAHGRGVTGEGVGVALIDTGVNQVHALRETDIVDGPDLSFDAGHEQLRHRDLYGHGTALASIIAAEDSGIGTGLAPDAEIVNVKVGAGDGTVDVTQVIAALDWVTRYGHELETPIRVINLAFTTDGVQDHTIDPLSQAVEAAWDAGIVVVVAAGNDGRRSQLGNPAVNPDILAVGSAAIRPSGRWKVDKQSSSGDRTRVPDLLAPGRHVLSAGVEGSYLAVHNPRARCVDDAGQLALRGSGTSQAAAVAAGAAALLLDDRPELTPDEVKHLLTSTAVRQSRGARHAAYGLVDVAAALAAPTPGDEAVQDNPPAVGGGSLDAARGKDRGSTSTPISGELTAFGTPWDPDDPGAMLDALLETAGATWSGATWSGATWSGATWSGATWSGATWSGATWSGATWSGATWSGATWSGATWSGATWAASAWQ